MKIKFAPPIKTVGYFLGAGIVYFALFIVNKVRTNNGTEKVNAYIANCKIIPLQVGDFNVVEGRITGYIAKNAKDYSREEAVFYDSAYKKYFSLEFMGSDQNEIAFNTFLIYHLRKGDEIKATVNKVELADSTYGTQKKPIPVFWFERLDGWKTFAEFVNGDLTTKSDTTQETKQMYHDAIGIYLTFVKSRKDFKKMFPDKLDEGKG